MKTTSPLSVYIILIFENSLISVLNQHTIFISILHTLMHTIKLWVMKIHKNVFSIMIYFYFLILWYAGREVFSPIYDFRQKYIQENSYLWFKKYIRMWPLNLTGVHCKSVTGLTFHFMSFIFFHTSIWKDIKGINGLYTSLIKYKNYLIMKIINIFFVKCIHSVNTDILLL